MNAQLAANAVTDAKIVSVSGSKISGAVVSAANLTNGSWNTSVGTVQLYGLTFPNIFSINSGTSPVFAMSTNGPFALKSFHVGSTLYLGDSATIVGYLYYTNTYGVVIGNSVAGYAATINGNLNVAGTVYQSSDRTLKDGFTPIDSQRILEKVSRLSISNWKFKTDAATRHIGPMAQDFYAAFNLGEDDKHIAIVDEVGVALAAIQGLNEKLKEKDAKIEAMEKRLADLEELIKSSTHK